jgi:hypothetical protein
MAMKNSKQNNPYSWSKIMIARNKTFFILVVMALALVALGSCERDLAGLEEAGNPSNGDVYLDAFSGGMDFAAFANTKLDAIYNDPVEKYEGTQSLRVTVPNPGNPTEQFAGGALYSSFPRDLSGYDALTFWAKSSMPAQMGLVGLGDDNTGTSRFVATRSNLAVNTIWQKYIVPIPDPSRLTAETGLFVFSIGAFEGNGFYVWFDEIQFETLGTIAQQPTVNFSENPLELEVGENKGPGISGLAMDVDGDIIDVNASMGYFELTSLDTNKVKVNLDGTLTGVTIGTAEVTIALGSQTLNETLNVTVVPATPKPTESAPTPTADPSDVISVLSDAYTNLANVDWFTYWEFTTGDVEEYVLNGTDQMYRYTDLNFFGIAFSSSAFDATALNRFHMDIWTPDAIVPGSQFIVKIENNIGSGTLGTITVNSADLVQEGWVSIDVALDDIAGLTSRDQIGQMIVESPTQGPNTVFVDNIYFYYEAPPEPDAPPVPSYDAADVISLFSNAYTDNTVDTWSAPWDNADVTDTQVDGDDTKLYTNAITAGIEFTSQTVDVSAMTHFRMDLWTASNTALPAVFRIKLVDFGANGIFGGGDDTEHELTLSAVSTPAIASEQWVTLDIPLFNFTSMTGRGHVAQLILSGDLGSFYIDNVMFHK